MRGDVDGGFVGGGFVGGGFVGGGFVSGGFVGGRFVGGRFVGQGREAGALAGPRGLRIGLRLQGRSLPGGAGVAAHCPLAVGARLISECQTQMTTGRGENSRNSRMNRTETKDP